MDKTQNEENVKSLEVLDKFFKYLLLQTFPKVLSSQNVGDYAEMLDSSCFG
jgi:hypothetical protein